MFTGKAGFAAVVANVNNNFGVKDYTQEMLDALKDPTANLALTIQAYQFFQAMKNGQDFVTPDGQKLSFANLPASLKNSLTTDVTNILKLYTPIKVPVDNKGDTAILLNPDGTTASLLDLVSNPTGNFHVSFNHALNGDDSPAWSKSADGTDLFGQFAAKFVFGFNCDLAGQAKNLWWLVMDFLPNGTQFNEQGLTVNGSAGSPCQGGVDWTLAGTPEQWAALGALDFGTGATAANQADYNNAQNTAQQGM